MAIMTRLARLRNAFFTSDENTTGHIQSYGPSTSTRPHLPRHRYTSERTIITSIYTRMGNDYAGIDIRHVKLDEKSRYINDVSGPLNRCFTIEANLDQAPRAFRQDIVMTLFDEGVAAIVPVDTTIDKKTGERISIETLRVGKIVQWYPRHVRVSLYNEEKGERQEIMLAKRDIAIIENPFYAIMNEPNSTLQRLIKKLNLLDVVDEQSSSGKLDIIIQLPYVIKTEARRQQAEKRREDIEFQLKDSRYGIAYTDGTEKITQLNRAAENNLLAQVEYLGGLLYEQLGITKQIMDGTADEATMINYFDRIIEPLLDASVEAMQRAFLGRKGIENNERIRYFRNPFKLVPLSQLAEIADKFTRNEILTSNELRDAMGIPPSDDPKADQLINSNMPQPNQVGAQPSVAEFDALMNETLDGLNSEIEEITKELTNV